MKTILRFLTAIAIGSVSLTSVRACSDFLSSVPPQGDTEFAVLLGWYNSNYVTKIEQKLWYNPDTYLFEIVSNDNLITDTNFKKQLLISNGNGFVAKNMNASKLLSQLGFNSGGLKTIYSNQDIADISNLTAVINHVNYGKVNLGSWDYQLDNGTMKVSVKLNDKILKNYNLDILNNNNLNIPQIAKQLVNEDTINLNKNSGFAVPNLTSNSILNLKHDQQREWTALLNFLLVTPLLTWTDSMDSIIEYFTSKPTFLQVNFGKIIVVNRFSVGIPK